MTSFRDMLGESLGIGERFRIEPRNIEVDETAGYPVASHPYDASPMDIAVVETGDRLEEPPEERPPTEPITVEVVGRIVDGRIAGRIVGSK